MKGRIIQFVGVFSAVTTMSCAKMEQEEKLNYIVIMADDISAIELGCYGNTEIETPNIDLLAEQGVQFITSWSTPLCQPSRVQLLTGRYATSTGWYSNDMKPAGDPHYGIYGDPDYNLTSELFFSKLFQQNGYKTAISGKWHIEEYPNWSTFSTDFGFDEYCLWGIPDSLPEGYEDYANVPGATGPYYKMGFRGPFWQPAIVENGKLGPTGVDDYGPDYFSDFICRFAEKNKDNPFMVYYPANIAHSWWYTPVSEETRWGTVGPVPELDSLGNKTGNRTPVGRDYAIEYLDFLVGKIVNKLEELDIRENTVIIFTTDNGAGKYGKGRIVSENGFRVPMIVNNPKIITEPLISESYVQLADVFPTLTDLAKITVPDSVKIDGISFIKTLLKGEPSPREYLYTYLDWKRAFKFNDYYLDGNDSLWYCQPISEFQFSYINMTDSLNNPEVVSVMKKMEELKDTYPAPDTTNNPMYERYKAKHKYFEEKINSITK